MSDEKRLRRTDRELSEPTEGDCERIAATEMPPKRARSIAVLKAAAAELRYEEAALLRDEIAELRSSIPG